MDKVNYFPQKVIAYARFLFSVVYLAAPSIDI